MYVFTVNAIQFRNLLDEEIMTTNYSLCYVSFLNLGDDLNRKESLFSAAVLIGLLKQRNNVTANFVNAPTLAKENGYEVIFMLTDNVQTVKKLSNHWNFVKTIKIIT